MKKFLLFLMFALFCIPWAAQAQSLFSEDFESGSMPTGWTTDGPGTWQIGTGDYSTSTGAGQGTYNALIKHGTTGNVTKLITPEIDLSSVSSALLSFMHVQRSWAGDIDNLRVYYRTSSSETWTLLTEYTTAISIWTAEEDIVLPNTSSTYQIAFECTDNYGYGVGIDYVQILAPSSCARPTALTSSDVTAHAATISWTSDASAWQVCLNDDENNLINVTTTSHTFSGLTAETTYSVKVRTNCNGTYSNWTSPVSFTTAVACPVPTLAYSGAVTNLTAHSGMVSWTENGSATEWVVAYKPSADTEFEEVTVTENSYVITNLEPETSYIVKVKAVCGGIDGESEWSDTRTFTTTVACPAPTNLQCNGATLTTATLSWFEGEATQWEVCLNDDEDNLISVFDSPTITIENLSPGTTYSFKVRAICDSASAWSSSFSFTTVFAIPMVQPFDATSIPAGWKMYTGLLGTDGTANLTSTTYGWTFGTGNGVFDSHARVNIYNTYQRWLVTPYLEMENNVRLTFDLALTAYSGTVAAPQTTGTDDKFAVLITTDNGSTWEVLRQWDNAGSEYVYNNITCSADGEFVNLDLSSYAGQNVAIAFYGESTVSNADNNLHIDNVTIEYIPSCEKPVALAVNYTGGTEATISWTSDAENFTLQYYNDFEESEEIEVTGNSYTLTGLELATTYNVMVQANCGQNGLSEWTNAVSFTTDLCMPENMCELTYELSDSYGDGWNGNYINVVDVETEAILATWTMSSGGSASGTLTVCDGQAIQFQYVVSGSYSYPSENSWVIKDINEEVIWEYESPSASMSQDHTVSCAVTTCRKPTNFAASNEGPTSVDLSWDENGESDRWQIRYKVATDSVYSASPVNATTNPFTLTGLHAETTYTAQVKPRCDVEKWSDEITFTTTENCPAPNDVTATPASNSASIEWTSVNENFDVRYRGTNPSNDFESSSLRGWKAIDADGDGYTWVLGSECGGVYLVEGGSLAGTGHNSSADMIVSGSYSNVSGALTPDNYLVSPLINLGGTISFYAAAQDSSYAAEVFGVAVSTTGNTADDFTTIQTWTMDANGGSRAQGNWGHFTVDLSEYSGQGYVAIRHYNCTDQFILLVDDIEITQPNYVEPEWTLVENVTSPYEITGLEPETEYEVEVRSSCGNDEYSAWTGTSFTTTPTCVTPTNLAVDNITGESAVVTWTSDAASFDIEVNSIVTEGVTNPYTLENLDPATIYTVKVRANCGDGDYSEWSVPYAFVTDCGGAKDLPYTFGFEDVNEYYSCWGTYAEDGNENSLGISAYGAAYEGSNVFVFSSYNSADSYDQYLYSPELNAEGEVALEFYYRSTAGYGSETFKVGYSTDGEEFIWGEEISTNDTTWTAYNDTLPAGAKFVAIHYYSDYQYYLVVDGFHVEEVVTTDEQTIALVQGTNWVSFNEEITLDDLKAALVAAAPGTAIKIYSQSNSTTYNPARDLWLGSLTWDVAQMFMIDVTTDCEIALEGTAINPADHPVSIVSGNNY
ncbi:MAG: choice-of-anchor J domain-containing protein, partial [Bacteroidales bacterium]|nr:choice-of-anchor J domain-containing protein [Bacteroidales bacterium]